MERMAWLRAKRMAAQGDEVTVLTTPVPGRPAEWHEDGVRVRTIADRPGRYSPRWWARTALLRGLSEYDAIHSESAGATAMIHLRPRHRYLFIAHGTAKQELMNALRVRTGRWPLRAIRYAYWIMLDALTYRRVDTVLASSSQVERGLRDRPYRGAWAVTELRLMPNAVDEQHFAYDPENRARARERYGFADSTRVVATISRLDRQKGVDRVINAVARQHGVHHVIAGLGPEDESLRALSRALGVEDRVHFVGHVDYDEVRDILAMADAFVLPARNFAREGLPLSVLEAKASGLRPVVPLESDWPADVADVVVRVDMDDVEELAATLVSPDLTLRG